MRPLALRTVLVATDLDESSDVALVSAHRLAECAGAALHVVHVPGDRGEMQASLPADPLDALRAVLLRAGVPESAAKVHVIPGVPADTIRSFADRMAADVIVIGPHRHRGRSARGHHLGGTARAIAVNAFAPCLVAPQPLRLPLDRVLVPIDLSDTARGALLVGLSWASALRIAPADDRGTTLTVLYVDTADAKKTRAGRMSTSVDDEVDAMRRSAGDWAGVTVRGIATKGRDAARRIAEYAVEQKVDLTVLGTRGLDVDDVARLGSVSASVTETLRLPVLLVPPAVWRAYAAVL